MGTNANANGANLIYNAVSWALIIVNAAVAVDPTNVNAALAVAANPVIAPPANVLAPAKLVMS